MSSVEHTGSISTNTSVVEEQANVTSDLCTAANATIDKNQLQITQSKTIGSFIILWLCSDANDSVSDRDDFIMQLRHVISSLHVFTEVTECADFVTNVPGENIVMIINDYPDQELFDVLDDIPQLHSVYIFNQEPEKHLQHTKDYKVVKGAYSKIEDICNAVKQDAHRLVVDLTPISIISPDSSVTLGELDPSFMYTQLLKEIIIDIKYDAEKAREQFTQFCLSRCSIDGFQPKAINEFEQCYKDHSPIWWYSKEWFLYSSLNRALRIQDVEMIMKMGFFMQDLHREIERQHSHAHQTSTIVVYRGQALSNNNFDKLRRSKGGLFSFNNFLSTSLDRAVSLMFADSNQQNPELTAVLFRMEIDPTISSTSFVRVENIGQFESEAEILFSMHTVFRIGDTNQLDVRLWEVNLTLTADNDQQLKSLTDCIRKEIEAENGWMRMVRLMLRIGKYEKALEISNMLRQEISEKDPQLLELLQSLMDSDIGAVHYSLGNYSTALISYEKLLKILQQYRANDHSWIAKLYCDIGATYRSMGDFSSALINHKKALESEERLLSPNLVALARIHNDIALTHHSMGSFSSALTYYEKVLKIQKQCLPSNHPNFAATHNNIAMLHATLGNYSSAVSHFKKTLHIQEKSLVLDHPYIAKTYSNIATVYVSMGSFSDALAYLKKALEIEQKSLPPNHPDLAATLHNMAVAHQSKGDYSAALSHYEEALQIRQKTLPCTHPNLAVIYYGIGSTHQSLGNYPTAKSNYERALEILQKCLPPHHPDIIRTQYKIVSLSQLNEDYLSGMLNGERAFENQQRLLSVNHLSSIVDRPNVNEILEKHSEMCSNSRRVAEMQQKLVSADGSNFTVTDQNIGEVKEFKKAVCTLLLSVEKFLQVQQKSPSFNHPLITGTQVDGNDEGQIIESSLRILPHLKKAFGMPQKSSLSIDEEANDDDGDTSQMPFSMNDFAAAMIFYQNIMMILQKYNPPNDVSLSTHYNNMGQTYYSMEDYSNALTLFQKGLGHLQTCSPINQQLLTKTYNNIAKALDGLGRYREATDYASQAYEVACSTLGSNHPETEAYRDYLDQLRRK